MNSIVLIRLAFCLLCLNASVSFADVQVSDAKIVLPAKGSDVAAAYGTFKNTAANEEVVKIKTLGPFGAGEFHETMSAGGQTSMKALDGLRIPAHALVHLEPGGRHLMLFKSKRPLKAGEKIEMVFEADGKTVPVKFEVIKRANLGH